MFASVSVSVSVSSLTAGVPEDGVFPIMNVAGIMDPVGLGTVGWGVELK